MLEADCVKTSRPVTLRSDLPHASEPPSNGQAGFTERGWIECAGTGEKPAQAGHLPDRRQPQQSAEWRTYRVVTIQKTSARC